MWYLNKKLALGFPNNLYYELAVRRATLILVAQGE
jgi:hypothetical protein